MKKQNLISVIAIVMLLSSIQVFSAKEVDLSYKLEKGKKYAMEINNRQTISMNMMGQSMNLTQNIVINQEILVADKIEDSYTLELNYKRIRFNQNAMGMEIQWDSDKPATEDPISQQVAASLGKAIGTTVTAIIDLRGQPLSNNRSEVITEASNVSGFESGMMIVYAGKKVSVGETWQVSLKPDPNSDFVITSDYTLDEIKGKNAHISFSGNITGTQLMGEKAEISGTLSGKTIVELASGWIVSASINQVMEMEMEQQGTTIPMQMNSFIEMNSK
ncbi:MAG: DUF6263 family protein [Bacteroidales bacterium]|nr:DUF6263 family protein [Bacteroidales bacterium]